MGIAPPAAASALGLLCVVYPIWRGDDSFPAVDRSHDQLAIALLDHYTATSPGGAVDGVDMNWPVQYAFEFFMRDRRPSTVAAPAEKICSAPSISTG